MGWNAKSVFASCIFILAITGTILLVLSATRAVWQDFGLSIKDAVDMAQISGAIVTAVTLVHTMLAYRKMRQESMGNELLSNFNKAAQQLIEIADTHSLLAGNGRIWTALTKYHQVKGELTNSSIVMSKQTDEELKNYLQFHYLPGIQLENLFKNVSTHENYESTKKEFTALVLKLSNDYVAVKAHRKHFYDACMRCYPAWCDSLEKVSTGEEYIVIPGKVVPIALPLKIYLIPHSDFTEIVDRLIQKNGMPPLMSRLALIYHMLDSTYYDLAAFTLAYMYFNGSFRDVLEELSRRQLDRETKPV